MESWFKDERLWDATRGFLFSGERWTAAGAEVDAILDRVGLEPYDEEASRLVLVARRGG